MKHISVLVMMMLLGMCREAVAQVSVGGTPYSFLAGGSTGRMEFESKNVALLRIDNEKEVADARSRELNCLSCKPAYGKGISADINVKRDGIMKVVPGGKLWLVTFNSPTALGLQFHFNAYNLPSKASLFIYNEDRSIVLGAFTHINNHPDHRFATQMIHGKSITLEYFEADDNEFAGELSIYRVIHVFDASYAARRAPDEQSLRTAATALPCMIDVACPEGDLFKDIKKSVCRISTYDENLNLAVSATGFLINNLDIIRQPYVITSWHTQVDRENLTDRFSEWLFEFDYEKPICGSIFGPTPQYSTNGADVVTGDKDYITTGGITVPGADYLLLDLQLANLDMMDVTYLGWDIRTNITYPKSATIHHPAGDVKKISLDTESPVPVHLSAVQGSKGPTLVDDANNPKLDWKVTWNGKGITQSESSGAPLIEQLNYRAIGYFRGGVSTCDANGGSVVNGPDYFGRLSTAWTAYNRDWFSYGLKQYLDPQDTRAVTAETYVLRPTITPPTGGNGSTYNDNGTLPTSVPLKAGITLQPTYKLGVFDDGTMGECKMPPNWKVTVGVAGTVNINQDVGGGKCIRMHSGGYGAASSEIGRPFNFEKGKEYILTLRVWGSVDQMAIKLRDNLNYPGDPIGGCNGSVSNVPVFAEDQEIMRLKSTMVPVGAYQFYTYAVKFVTKRSSKYLTIAVYNHNVASNDPTNQGMAYSYVDEVYLFDSNAFINPRANDDWSYVSAVPVAGDTCANRSLVTSSPTTDAAFVVASGTSLALSSQAVKLAPNFRAEPGSTFRVYVGGCASTQRTAPTGPLEKNKISTMGRMAEELAYDAYNPVTMYNYNALENIYRPNVTTARTWAIAKERPFELTASPNPAKDRVVIHFSEGGESIPYSVLDITGNEITRGVATGANEEIDFSRYGNGIYFVKARYRDRYYITRLVLFKN